MTHQHQIIAFCILAAIAVPVGTLIAIKTINKLSGHPVNSLHRRNDIELQEVIDPIQHINGRDIDLSSLPQYPQAMFNYQLPISWDHPPRYSQLTDNFINSPLEMDSWDFIPWLKFLLILIVLIKFWLMKSLYSMSILIPFSLFDIDFRDSFEWKFNSYRVKPKISYLKIQTLTQDIIDLLDSLEDNTNFSMSLSFISSYKEWQDNKERIHPLFIDDAIIINKESDPILITQFIMNRLDDKGYFMTNWLFKDTSINKMDPVILTVTVSINVEI